MSSYTPGSQTKNWVVCSFSGNPHLVVLISLAFVRRLLLNPVAFFFPDADKTNREVGNFNGGAFFRSWFGKDIPIRLERCNGPHPGLRMTYGYALLHSS
jgi:hypothetical protein